MKQKLKKADPVITIKNRKRILSCFTTAELLEELIGRQGKEQITPKWEKINDEYDRV